MRIRTAVIISLLFLKYRTIFLIFPKREKLSTSIEIRGFDFSWELIRFSYFSFQSNSIALSCVRCLREKEREMWNDRNGLRRKDLPMVGHIENHNATFLFLIASAIFWKLFRVKFFKVYKNAYTQCIKILTQNRYYISLIILNIPLNATIQLFLSGITSI